MEEKILCLSLTPGVRHPEEGEDGQGSESNNIQNLGGGKRQETTHKLGGPVDDIIRCGALGANDEDNSVSQERAYRGYCTISTEVARVLSGLILLDLMVDERRRSAGLTNAGKKIQKRQTLNEVQRR